MELPTFLPANFMNIGAEVGT